MPILSTRPNFNFANDSPPANHRSPTFLMAPVDRQDTLATNGLRAENGNESDEQPSTSPPDLVTTNIPNIVIDDNRSGSSLSNHSTDAITHHVARARNEEIKRHARYHKSSYTALMTTTTSGATRNVTEAFLQAPLDLQKLRKSNSLSLLGADGDTMAPRPLSRANSSKHPSFLLSVMSITASDSVSYIGNNPDDDDDIGRTSDLDDDMFLTHNNSGEVSSETASDKLTPSDHQQSSAWKRPIRASWTANNTFNPIRAIVDKMTVKPNPNKPVISLSIGDPTFYGNMMPASTTIDAVREALDSGKFHGYTPAAGMPLAREAVAKHLNTWFEPPSGDAGHALQADDIFLTHGCSHALDLCLTVLCDSGTSNVVLPRPGFPIYTTLSMSRNVECRSYRLLPHLNFEADLEHMEQLIDEHTAAIVVTNPANPCGSVYSRQHLLDIVALARRHQVPIIADEIYCDFVFHKSRFIPIGSLSDDVPVLSAGGLTKKYIVPGWRLGWVAIYDRDKLFDAEVRDGLNALCQRILGPCSLIQGALPAILARPPVEHISQMISISETNARLAHEAISAMPGVRALMPQGAMYMMVEILVDQFDGTFSSDVDFTWRLMSEQSVYCLPGSIFGSDNFVRLVLTLPDDKMKEALSRMHEFCEAHYVGESVHS